MCLGSSSRQPSSSGSIQMAPRRALSASRRSGAAAMRRAFSMGLADLICRICEPSGSWTVVPLKVTDHGPGVCFVFIYCSLRSSRPR